MDPAPYRQSARWAGPPGRGELHRRQAQETVTYVSAIAIVVSCVAVAALASVLVNRFVPRSARSRHYEVGVQIFLQLGVLFAVLLAFVFNEVWGEYNTAAQAINGECGALHGASMLSAAISDDGGRPVDQAIVVYVRTVVEKEWPSMAQRRRSEQAAGDLRAILDHAAQLTPTRPNEVTVQSQVLSLLAVAHSYRETRLFQMTLGVPLAMWLVLVTLALFLIALVLLSTADGLGHLLFACSFTACTVMVLVLVRMLDLPFEGALGLPDADFVKLLGEVSSLVSGR